MHQDLNLLLSGFGSSPTQDMFQVLSSSFHTGFGFCCCFFLKSIYLPLE